MNRENLPTGEFASGAPVTLLAKAEAALHGIIYRFRALANDLAICSESRKEKNLRLNEAVWQRQIGG